MSEDKYFDEAPDPDKEKKIKAAAKAIAEANHLVVFTGAGISTESGLPDFRGPKGVWTMRDKGKEAPGPSVPWSEVAPNSGHMALVKLQEMGRLKFLISQNVDNLHLKSGIDPDKIAELHGNSTQMKCLKCDRRYSKEELGWDERKWGRGYRTQKPKGGQPTCPECGNRIISTVINFGDPMPEREMEEAERHSRLSDVFVAVGSTLSVTPAADFPRIALDSEPRATLIIINLGETALDNLAHIRISGKAGEVLGKIVT